MSFLKIKGFSLAALALVALAACEPAPTQREKTAEVVASCNGQLACSVAILAADRLNQESGKNYGSGVVLRGAKAIDKTLVVGIDIPAYAPLLPVKNGKGPKQQIRDILVRGTCRTPEMQPFFNAGGVLQLQTYLPSGEVFSNDKVRRC